MKLPHVIISYAELPDTIKNIYKNAYVKTDYNDEAVNLNTDSEYYIESKDGIANSSQWKRYFHIDEYTYKLTWTDTRNANNGPYILFGHQLYFLWDEDFDISDLSTESYMVINLNH
jgi:hypothetical protein